MVDKKEVLQSRTKSITDYVSNGYITEADLACENMIDYIGTCLLEADANNKEVLVLLRQKTIKISNRIRSSDLIEAKEILVDLYNDIQ